MKVTLPCIIFFCCIFLAGHALAAGTPEDFIGPEPGTVHVYEKYQGGFTRVWGLDRTSSGELTTVVETTPPTAALGENGIRHASCLLRKYVVSGCRVIAKAGAESHIVLDLCHEEWTYQALLHVGTDATHTRSRGYSGKKQDILCRIVSHTILPFQGKEREVIQVAYSYVTQKNERRVLGRAFFVEGLGQLLGDVSEPLLCRQATELELKKIRRFVDKNEYHQGADFGAEMF